MIDETPYTREEVLSNKNEFPTRGLLCPKCGIVIPQFTDLSDIDRSRIKKLITNSQPMLAMEELRAATGCSLLWAKIWVTHTGKPQWDRETSAPCPYCGKPLRTPVAKQCRHCLMDWHDAQNPKSISKLVE